MLVEVVAEEIVAVTESLPLAVVTTLVEATVLAVVVDRFPLEVLIPVPVGTEALVELLDVEVITAVVLTPVVVVAEIGLTVVVFPAVGRTVVVLVAVGIRVVVLIAAVGVAVPLGLNGMQR